VDDDLLNECDVQVFRAEDGRHSAAVRLIHRPTGIIVEAEREPTLTANRDVALASLKSRLSQ
jgi:protein subunit release factor A